MNQFDRLEALAQGLIEGIFSRLFQARLRPPASAPTTDSGVRARQWTLKIGERHLRLGEPVVRLGRAGDNDIVLTDPMVCSYHAQLRWRQGRYHLYPPIPVNGHPMASAVDSESGIVVPYTAVNDQPRTLYPLSSGDVIGLGQTVMTVVVERS